eukprot:m.164608 g.164608  ORF g.164608 m.164608 type:complete len:723 (+) comp12447_c0_seq1:54-2222(+)
MAAVPLGRTGSLGPGALPRRANSKRQDEEACCKRERCNRREDLSDDGYCKDHGCPIPTCKSSKSSSAPLCDACLHHSKEPLPKGWYKIPQPPEGAIYICEKTQVAQWLHPGGKGERALPRKSKLLLQKRKKDVPIQYVIQPQPDDLPDPWEVILAVPTPGSAKDYASSAAVQLYLNTADTRIQRSDPRPEPEDEDGPLPAGWEKCLDEGEAYFHNLNTSVLTYDDPRHVVNPTPSQYLTAKYSHNPFFNQGDVQAGKPTTDPQQGLLKIGPCDMVAFADLDDNLTWEDEIPECVRSKVYNRYMDILPEPKTRVPLPMINNDPRTEYINANFVRGPDGNPKHYVCAMGPKPTTVDQYWRMLWQEKPFAIVMITGIIEKGQPKCERYWPGIPDGKTMLSFDDNRIRAVTLKSDPTPKGYVRSTIKAVGPDPKKGRASHEIEHFWYNTWPDHGVPRKGSNPMYTDDCIGMVKAVNAYVAERNAKLKHKKTQSLILVHCSAGIGRTGTYVCLDHCMHLLDTKSEVDPLKVVENVRNDRCALVQHPAQFSFVHAGTVGYAKRSGKNVQVAPPALDEATMNARVKMTEKEKQKKRAAEKQAALQRIENAKRDGSKMGRRTSAGMVASEGELDLGFIHFEGRDYKFFDPDGDGHMDLSEAAKSGFPRALFRLLDKDNDGRITPAEFKNYQREQRRMRRAKTTGDGGDGVKHRETRASAPIPAPAGGWPD